MAETPQTEQETSQPSNQVVPISPERLPQRQDAQTQARRPGGQVRARRRARFTPMMGFILMVVIPTLASAFYLFGVAADQYISHAQFILRSSDKSPLPDLGGLLQTAGVGESQEDTFAVIEFMKSRDALKLVDGTLDYKAIMSREGADPLARYPSVIYGNTFEEMHSHYMQTVEVVYNPSNGISNITTYAFRPEDAYAIANLLLTEGEGLVNRMNSRSREDALRLAREEVRRSEKRLAEAQLAVSRYRNESGIVDPEAMSTQMLAIISEIQLQLIEAESQLGLLEAQGSTGPRVEQLRSRVTVLRQKLAEERAKIAGGSGSMAEFFSEFERLQIEVKFAAESLVSAQTALERARTDILRQQLYLERVVEPNAADYSRAPRRILLTLTIFVTLFLIFAIIWLLRVNTQEHKA